MSFEKVVIQQNQQDGSYLELYPKSDSFTKKETLLPTTSASYDLPESSVPDDVFQNIRVRLNLIGSGQAYLALTLVDTNGNKRSGVKVAGFVDREVYSDDNGVAKGYIVINGATLKVSDYADIIDNSIEVTAKSGEFVAQTLTLNSQNFLQINSSKSYMFSPNVQSVDVSVGGGGGGGAGGTDESDYYLGGGGGGGGFAKIENSVVFKQNVLYPAVVGAGRKGSEIDATVQAGNGGVSSFLGVLANGGSGAKRTNGGEGNGKGGEGCYYYYTRYVQATARSNGSGTVFSSFTEEVSYGGGGGGGGSHSFSTSSRDGAILDGAQGGSPNGTRGGQRYAGAGPQNAKAHSGGGAGGGRAYGYSDDDGYGTASQKGANGGSGVVAIRMHLKNI